MIIIPKTTAAITIIQLPYMSIPAERRLRESLLRKRLEKELLRKTSVGGKDIKYTDGTEGDYRYKYCNYTDKFEMQSSSYFSIVAESSDKVTVYILNSDYKKSFRRAV